MATLTFFTILNFILLLVFSSYFLYRLTSKRQAEKILEDVRHQINKLISQLDQVSDRNLTLMENSIDDLKKTISESKRREKNIKELIGSPKNLEQIHDNFLAKTKLRAATSRSLYASNKAQPKSKEKKSQLVDSQDQDISMEYQRQQIIALAKSGVTHQEIATNLNLTLSEVELVISLAMLEKKK